MPVHVDNPIVRTFMRDYLRGGGAIPKRRSLGPYLNDIYSVDKKKSFDYFAGRHIQIILDEIFDKEGRYVVCFLVAVIKMEVRHVPLLAKMYFEKEALTRGLTAQIVLKTLNEYMISYNDVIAIATDNAS